MTRPEPTGLTPARIFIAIAIAIVITIAYVFVTAPHPVSVPQQVITPVPTPPPVVITEYATPAPVSESTTCGSSHVSFAPIILGFIAAIMAMVLGLAGLIEVPTAINFTVMIVGFIVCMYVIGVVLDATYCSLGI